MILNWSRGGPAASHRENRVIPAYFSPLFQVFFSRPASLKRSSSGRPLEMHKVCFRGSVSDLERVTSTSNALTSERRLCRWKRRAGFHIFSRFDFNILAGPTRVSTVFLRFLLLSFNFSPQVLLESQTPFHAAVNFIFGVRTILLQLSSWLPIVTAPLVRPMKSARFPHRMRRIIKRRYLKVKESLPFFSRVISIQFRVVIRTPAACFVWFFILFFLNFCIGAPSRYER